jgi:ribosomal protein L40E
VICRNCGTEIAAKALICYRCGTATTEARIKAPERVPARGPLPLVAALLVLVLLAVFAVPPLPDGPPELAAWGALAAAAIAAGVLLRPRARRR